MAIHSAVVDFLQVCHPNAISSGNTRSSAAARFRAENWWTCGGCFPLLPAHCMQLLCFGDGGCGTINLLGLMTVNTILWLRPSSAFSCTISQAKSRHPAACPGLTSVLDLHRLGCHGWPHFGSFSVMVFMLCSWATCWRTTCCTVFLSCPRNYSAKSSVLLHLSTRHEGR